MTRPRQRTRLLVGALLCSALIAGGTLPSLQAAPSKGRSRAKKASITVKRQRESQNSVPPARTANESAEDEALREALARRRAWSEPRRPWTAETDPGMPDSPVDSEAPVQLARADDPKANNEDLIREALRNRGRPYVWGGASRGGFDCSGFVMYIFKKQRGIRLPHSAAAQARMGTPVRRQDLQPGDLVFFSTYRRGISHVGIYIGNNRFIHAANSRKDVRVDSLTGYWARRLKAARRISPAPMQVSPRDVREYLDEPSEMPEAEEGTQ